MESAVRQLDNPVWFALSETHAHLSIEYPGLRFYDPDYCPFGAMHEPQDINSAFNSYAGLTSDFFIVGNRPPIPDPLHLQKELVCAQMIVEHEVTVNRTIDIIRLTTEHHQQLFHLVNLVQPGYFRKKTALLGHYYGIFEEDLLVAVTGERMQTRNWIEISAVVTHPAYTGRSYATQLVAHTAHHIIKQNKRPFLHVAQSNTAAISLYKKLGFSIRREISFWHIERKEV